MFSEGTNAYLSHGIVSQPQTATSSTTRTQQALSTSDAPSSMHPNTHHGTGATHSNNTLFTNLAIVGGVIGMAAIAVACHLWHIRFNKRQKEAARRALRNSQAAHADQISRASATFFCISSHLTVQQGGRPISNLLMASHNDSLLVSDTSQQNSEFSADPTTMGLPLYQDAVLNSARGCPPSYQEIASENCHSLHSPPAYTEVASNNTMGLLTQPCGGVNGQGDRYSEEINTSNPDHQMIQVMPCHPIVAFSGTRDGLPTYQEAVQVSAYRVLRT